VPLPLNSLMPSLVAAGCGQSTPAALATLPALAVQTTETPGLTGSISTPPALSGPPSTLPAASTLAPPPPQTQPGASTQPNPPAATGLESSARTAALGAAAATALSVPAPALTTSAESKAAAPPGRGASAPDALDSPSAATPNTPVLAQSAHGFAAMLAQAQTDKSPSSEASIDGARTPETPPMLLGQPPHAVTPDTPSPARTVHQAALPSRPLDAAFGGDLAAEVRVMINAGNQRAELHLNPPELGPIQIELSLNAQTADISFVAAHSVTRDGLSQALPELRQMLAGQGLSLGQAGVSSGQQGQGFAEAQQQARAAPAGPQRTAAALESGDSGWTSGAAVVRPGRGMLDLYA
jgi:flagellar hook-length control protein FliK